MFIFRYLIPFIIKFSSIDLMFCLNRDNYLDWGNFPSNKNIGLFKSISLFSIKDYNEVNYIKEKGVKIFVD